MDELTRRILNGLAKNLPNDVLIGLLEDLVLANRAVANPALPVEVMERLIERAT